MVYLSASYDHHTFADTFLSADLRAIFHSMKGKVYLRNGLFVLEGMGEWIHRGREQAHQARVENGDGGQQPNVKILC